MFNTYVLTYSENVTLKNPIVKYYNVAVYQCNAYVKNWVNIGIQPAPKCCALSNPNGYLYMFTRSNNLNI